MGPYQIGGLTLILPDISLFVNIVFTISLIYLSLPSFNLSWLKSYKIFLKLLLITRKHLRQLM